MVDCGELMVVCVVVKNAPWDLDLFLDAVGGVSGTLFQGNGRDFKLWVERFERFR